MQSWSPLTAFAAFAIGLVALWAPFFVAAWLVLFRGSGVRARWLFLLVGPIVVYSILWVITVIFIIPASFVLVLVAPATKDMFNQMPYWFSVAAWVTQYQWVVAAVLCTSLSAWLARWVWPRWPALLAAITSPPAARSGAPHAK